MDCMMKSHDLWKCLLFFVTIVSKTKHSVANTHVMCFVRFAITHLRGRLLIWQFYDKLWLRICSKHILLFPVSTSVNWRIFRKNGNIISDDGTHLIFCTPRVRFFQTPVFQSLFWNLPWLYYCISRESI